MKTYEPCMTCKGLGFLNKDELIEIPDICPDCYGKGKLDWIETIIGAKKPWGFGTLSQSSQVKYIQKHIEYLLESFIFEPNDHLTHHHIYYQISSFLNMCKSKRQIYQWQINMLGKDDYLLHPDEKTNHNLKKLDVNIQLFKVARFINLKFVVNNE